MYVLLQLMSVCILAAFVAIANFMQEVCFGITAVLATAIARVFENHSCCDLIMTSTEQTFHINASKAAGELRLQKGHDNCLSCMSRHTVSGVQVWNLTNCKLRSNLIGHTGYINTVTVSPDGSLCASGGKVSSLLYLCLCNTASAFFLICL